MTATRMRWGGWLVQLMAGCGLLLGPAAIASESVLKENASAMDMTVSDAKPDEASTPTVTTDRWLRERWLTQSDLAEPAAEVVEITDIQLEETAAGIALQLETTGELITPELSVAGNAAILDIPNAILNLPEAERFAISAPNADIAFIDINNRPDNQVRIAITGTEAPPTLSVTTVATMLTVRAIARASTAQDSMPDPMPEPMPDPSEDAIAGDPVPGSSGSDDAIQIIVTGGQVQDNYFVPNASSATRTDTPILETPASVQVIPRQVLEDQQVRDLGDALRNLSGASVNSTEGRGFQISLRGFNGVSVYRDGFRLYSPNDNGDAAGQGFPEIANIERIEVLRGPASVLFGQSEPGGILNIVSKAPLEQPFYEIGLQTDSRGSVRPQIDISGPLTEDNRLLYRLNAVYQNENEFQDFDERSERFFVAPDLAWRINDRTDLNLQLEYLNDDRPFNPGLVALGDEVADIPRDRILGEPDDSISSEFSNVGYDLEHRFSDTWKIRNAFRYLNQSDDISATLSFPFIGGLDEATGDLNRVFAEQDVNNKTLALQTNVVGEFSTGPVDHTLLVGVDLARYSLDSDSFTDFSPGPSRTPINIFDPVYGTPPRPERGDVPTRSDRIDTNSLQIYAQDQIDLLDNLILVAGFSYETVEQTTVTTSRGVTTEVDLTEDAFSPRIGLVYQPIENLSLYANYSRSFFPSAAVTVDGEPLAAEEGEGFEVGLKTELFEGNLLATLAYFNLTKQNVATTDLNDPRFSVATGEQQSQGIELDVIGEISPAWNVVASYAYIDSALTEDSSIETGNPLPGVPEHSASLWTNYEIQSGDLTGLGFGLGLNWVGERQGDLSNSFDLDSYFLTNAAVSYERNRWKFGLNFQNLFDVSFIEGTPRTRTRGIEPGDPFTVLGSVSYEF
ncbi:TonB-dependent siderophore receptor subfamily [Synechococcus sp. PCC 7335]|uniref:TonB-dependent siderophore receptor n=1 Tax=Synechococcus sp. (strain ATCC 29403 / PCC 7335) TaxID=91464 RepID=UPI00017ED58C|nr:TonB-dependent siderophore receptor [Synechococcus sp. PCC 7335]EDX87741.1 TonB-dependent siderophore receptor subfamily [Synechococcus sp. PCC 7335]